MRDTVLRAPLLHKRAIEFSSEERAELNTVIDLLIPSDEHFPLPSSLHLIDEFLRQLLPAMAHNHAVALNETRLRSVLRDLNASAGGNFCDANHEMQQTILRHLEQQDPALFQAMWTLANHSYYTLLATRRQSSPRA